MTSNQKPGTPSRRELLKATSATVLVGAGIAVGSGGTAATPPPGDDDGTGNPKFNDKKSKVEGIDDDGCLHVHLEGTGVGSDDVELTTTVTLNATYYCVNTHGNKYSIACDSKKTTGPITRSRTDDLTSERSGRFSRDQTICAPDPEDELDDCPGGFEPLLQKVTVSNVTSVLTRGDEELDSITLEGEDRTFFDVKDCP